MSSIDYKRLRESLKSAHFRNAVRKALREAKTTTRVPPRVPQVRELTANERDRLMHLRLYHDAAMRERAAQVFGRKKKLPLPVFSCENDDTCEVCGALVENCRGMENNVFTHAPAGKQLRPRVLGEGAK